MSAEATGDGQPADVMSDIQMPLENLAYTIEAYLLANGTWLDPETRLLLAGVRDCADRVAGSARRMAGHGAPRASRAPCRNVGTRAASTA